MIESMDGKLMNRLAGVLLVVLTVASVQGCASVAEGVTRELMAEDGDRMAGPMAAHDSYEAHERVIGLMVGGIGYDRTDAKVASECRWLETVN